MNVPIVRQNASQIKTDSFKFFNVMKLLKSKCIRKVFWVSLCCIEFWMKSSMFYPFFHPLKGGWFWPGKAEDSSCSSPWMPRGKLPTQWWRMWGAARWVLLVFFFSSGDMNGYDSWYITLLIICIFMCHFSLLKHHTSQTPHYEAISYAW